MIGKVSDWAHSQDTFRHPREHNGEADERTLQAAAEAEALVIGVHALTHSMLASSTHQTMFEQSAGGRRSRESVLHSKKKSLVRRRSRGFEADTTQP